MSDLDVRTAQAKFENEVGPKIDFGSRPRCPACHGLEIRTEFCRGPETLVKTKGVQCPIEGRHLHRLCSCLNHWIERTADDPENQPPEATYALPEAPECLAALVEMARGILTIPADVLERVQRDAPSVVVDAFAFGARLSLREEDGGRARLCLRCGEPVTESERESHLNLCSGVNGVKVSG